MRKFLIAFVLFLMPITGLASSTAGWVRTDYTITPVTTTASTTVLAALPSAINYVVIFDSSGQDVSLTCGTSTLAIPPGGGNFPFNCNAGQSLVLKSITATASTGENLISYFFN